MGNENIFPDSVVKSEVDLFGQPVVALRDRRGRPSFAKTLENQDFVSVRAAAGWSQETIAADMGIDPKTLRKNFSRELGHGALFVEGLMLDVLLKRVRTGHVPSIRRLQDRLDMTGPQAPKAPRNPKTSAAPSLRLGKKEQMALDRQEVPDDFGNVFDRRNELN